MFWWNVKSIDIIVMSTSMQMVFLANKVCKTHPVHLIEKLLGETMIQLDYKRQRSSGKLDWKRTVLYTRLTHRWWWRGSMMWITSGLLRMHSDDWRNLLSRTTVQISTNLSTKHLLQKHSTCFYQTSAVKFTKNHTFTKDKMIIIYIINFSDACNLEMKRHVPTKSFCIKRQHAWLADVLYLENI